MYLYTSGIELHTRQCCAFFFNNLTIKLFCNSALFFLATIKLSTERMNDHLFNKLYKFSAKENIYEYDNFN